MNMLCWAYAPCSLVSSHPSVLVVDQDCGSRIEKSGRKRAYGRNPEIYVAMSPFSRVLVPIGYRYDRSRLVRWPIWTNTYTFGAFAFFFETYDCRMICKTLYFWTVGLQSWPNRMRTLNIRDGPWWWSEQIFNEKILSLRPDIVRTFLVKMSQNALPSMMACPYII